MAINPDLIETKTIPELPDLAIALENFFAHSGANGIAGKATINQLVAIIQANVPSLDSSPFVPNTGSPLPNPIDKPTAITFVGAGTFDQTTGADVVTTEELNVLFWSSNLTTGTWTIGVAISIDLSGYATIVMVQDSIDSTEQNFVRTDVDTLISKTFDPVVTAPLFSDTGGTFSGWATSIGTPQNFNKIPLKIKTRTTPFTQISFRIFDIDANASIYDETRSGLSLSASTSYTLNFIFP